MNFHEYQAKQLFADYGIAVPAGRVASSPEEAVDAGKAIGGDVRIIGVMIESHLVAGRQDLVPGQPLTYGQSITDACIGWDDSVAALEILADAVRKRRLRAANESVK